MTSTFLSIDAPALITAILTAVLCAVCGTFLVARKEAMMTDTLSHSVLTGLVGAYLIFGTLHPAAMFLGALATCLSAGAMVFALQRYAGLSPAAAMGTVFTSLFALGLVLLEKFVGGDVHLDAHHALYGALELLYWAPPHDITALPRAIKTLLVVGGITALTMPLLFSPLKASSFDAVFARSVGFRPALAYAALLLLTILTAVAAFDAVGVVLVIALFVCPPAAARLYTNDLKTMMGVAIIIGICAAIAGYSIAAFVPPLLGFDHALSAGGMIAAVCGVILGGTIAIKSRAVV